MPAPKGRDALQLPAYPLYMLISPDYAASLRPPLPPPAEDEGEEPDAVAGSRWPDLR